MNVSETPLCERNVFRRRLHATERRSSPIVAGHCGRFAIMVRGWGSANPPENGVIEGTCTSERRAPTCPLWLAYGGPQFADEQRSTTALRRSALRPQLAMAVIRSRHFHGLNATPTKMRNSGDLVIPAHARRGNECAPICLIPDRESKWIEHQRLGPRLKKIARHGPNPAQPGPGRAIARVSLWDSQARRGKSSGRVSMQ